MWNVGGFHFVFAIIFFCIWFCPACAPWQSRLHTWDSLPYFPQLWLLDDGMLSIPCWFSLSPGVSVRNLSSRERQMQRIRKQNIRAAPRQKGQIMQKWGQLRTSCLGIGCLHEFWTLVGLASTSIHYSVPSKGVLPQGSIVMGAWFLPCCYLDVTGRLGLSGHDSHSSKFISVFCYWVRPLEHNKYNQFLSFLMHFKLNTISKLEFRMSKIGIQVLKCYFKKQWQLQPCLSNSQPWELILSFIEWCPGYRGPTE
jgi:hypothetical protein